MFVTLVSFQALDLPGFSTLPPPPECSVKEEEEVWISFSEFRRGILEYLGGGDHEEDDADSGNGSNSGRSKLYVHQDLQGSV